MNRQPVKSSNLISVGYDAETRVLEVEFVNHRVYEYLDVDAYVYTLLLNARSVGKAFAQLVRDQYVAREVTPVKENTPSA